MAKESVYYKIENLDNKSDLKAIKKGLDSIAGVLSVSVSADKDRVAVDFDTTGTTEEKIESHLNKMGYEITKAATEKHIM